VAGTIITHAELDQRLDPLAQDLDGFTAGCELLAREWNQAEVALEVSDPMSWRKPAPDSGKVSMRQQFRTEVDSIVPMDREQEARLARRIEFARIRLDDALKGAGLSSADLVEGIHGSSSGFVGSFTADCELAPQVCRRWLELHALRVEMVERNLYLVLINVERYSHTTASQVDLIQEGSAALFRAVDGFDWRRGLLFRTYAVHWLNQAFRSYLYNFTNTVRVPVYLQKAMKHVNDARNRLGNAKASVEEIAAEADLGENLVASAIAAARSSRSLDKAFDDDDEGGRLRDLLQVADDDGPYSTDLEEVTLEDSLSEALDRLSDRERYVIEMRFGINHGRAHTLAEVAKELGVSLERVRQIQVRAINKLRNPTLRRAIDPFLN
jgi:RNA polymerase sigma factor (sigma-70 family)